MAIGVVSALAATVATVIGLAPSAQAIADGELVPEGKYQFSVKLTMTNIPRPDGSHYDSACSAALVSEWWVITAGHCFHDVARNRVSGPVPYPTVATLGRVDYTGTGGHDVPVVWVQQSSRTDIALAKLAEPVQDIRPLALATKKPKVGQVLRITGWGATDSVDPVPGTLLRTGQVKVSSVTSSVVGVQGFQPKPTTSACLYDSGAPYFLEPADHAPVLVSVESDGPDCPHHLEETTSRVDNIVSWIHSVIG
jgi:secreted trypsin-like serine protease